MSDPLPPRAPPRFVPVLTEVVHADAPAEPAWQPGAPAVFDAVPHGTQPAPSSAPAAPSPSADALQEQLIHRVMQRVDVSLERQLDDAVAAVVLQHTHALVPRLREEIEFIVRQAVAEAVAAELAQRPAPAP